MERDEVPLGGRMNEQVGNVEGLPAEEGILESAETAGEERRKGIERLGW